MRRWRRISVEPPVTFSSSRQNERALFGFHQRCVGSSCSQSSRLNQEFSMRIDAQNVGTTLPRFEMQADTTVKPPACARKQPFALPTWLQPAKWSDWPPALLMKFVLSLRQPFTLMALSESVPV